MVQQNIRWIQCFEYPHELAWKVIILEYPYSTVRNPVKQTEFQVHTLTSLTSRTHRPIHRHSRGE